VQYFPVHHSDNPAVISTPPLSPAVFQAKCRFCGKWRHPREFIHDHIVGYCWYCLEWHLQALRVFGGSRPEGCQECNATYEALEAISPRGDVRFGFHLKDGVWQILGVACGCSDAYERKRLDMYGSTPYGERKKLKGAK
jgi:hypothetical protein